MKKLLLVFLAVGTAFAISPCARAQNNFTFTFSAPDFGIFGSGTLTGNGNGAGMFLITDGTVTIDGTNLFGGSATPVTGTGSLIANYNPSGSAISPSGYFGYDDELAPQQNPELDFDGLLFDVGGTELDLYYSDFFGTTYPYAFEENNGYFDSGSFSATEVPEGGAPWMYLLLAAVGCLMAVFFKKRNVLAIQEPAIARPWSGPARGSRLSDLAEG
ncbi:MAG: hypothetical protein ACRD3N_02660 [Terracidiphilus sp.]